jgi:hypothetical protein
MSKHWSRIKVKTAAIMRPHFIGVSECRWAHLRPNCDSEGRASPSDTLQCESLRVCPYVSAFASMSHSRCVCARACLGACLRTCMRGVSTLCLRLRRFLCVCVCLSCAWAYLCVCACRGCLLRVGVRTVRACVLVCMHMCAGVCLCARCVCMRMCAPVLPMNLS